MHGTLIEGDVVLINKLAYGPRLPITPFVFQINGRQNYLPLCLPYFRLPGYDLVSRNDIVAYNYDLSDDRPLDLREEYIKRCVGLPGDTISIADGVVKVSSSTIKNHSNVHPMNRQILKRGHFNPAVFPNHPAFKWNTDQLGPLYVPRSGESVRLTDSTMILYQRLILRYEGHTIEKKGKTFFVDQKPAIYYTFSKNYFFLIGDNRDDSIDCRFTGLIPEDHVIGRAEFVLLSAQQPSRRFLMLN